MNGRTRLGTAARALAIAFIPAVVACGSGDGTESSYSHYGASSNNGGGTSGGNKSGGSSSSNGSGNGSGSNNTSGGGDSTNNTPATPPPPCPAVALSATMSGLIGDITSSMQATAGPNTSVMSIPTDTDRDAFAQQVLVALTFDGTQKCPLPSSYGVFSLTDNGDDVRIVAELDSHGKPAPQAYWGTYAARREKTGTRAIIIEAPHPLADANTEVESAQVFSNAHAEWFMLAGTHRCAETGQSGCDGETDTCSPGKQQPYRDADAAHSTKTPFWAVHLAVSNITPDPIIQLHGNNASCPTALIADGSGTWTATSFAGRIATALEAESTTVGRCGSGYPTTACTLCATDNVEARATAGSSTACTAMGTQYERFVHIEQQPGLRTAPQPLLDAINKTFTAR
jgi:hypothetical protein